jgi:hypothetical protein
LVLFFFSFYGLTKNKRSWLIGHDNGTLTFHFPPKKEKNLGMSSFSSTV